MTESTIVPVILSGGSGTRLWPLSTAAHPKQFHSLVSDRTLFQEAVARADALPATTRPIVVCNAAHREFVRSNLEAMSVEPAAIVLEPCGRNTAPAIGAAAMIALREFDEPRLLVLAADHVIEDQIAFRGAVNAAVAAAQENYLVTFGIVPNRPETGYGYLLKGESHGDWARLRRFVEKPDRKTAEQYLASGEYLWNSGMFMMSARLFLDELDAHEPQMFAAVRSAVDEAADVEGCLLLGPSFDTCPANSIDYAVMERTQRAAVVPLDAGWSDVGSWAALREARQQDSHGNVLHGDVVAMNVSQSFVRATSKRVAIAGLDHVVVVETEDTILVMAESESQNVKRLIELSAQRDKKESS